jgi:hypothetical protein
MPKPVKRTSNITFNESDRTFRLYAGNSIYAFCINSDLGLEHLHWGEAISSKYDLRYLNNSSRPTHFNTIEAAPDRFTGKIVLAAETLDEIQRTWRENKVWVPTDMNDQERFHKRRLENYSWRLMTKLMNDKGKPKGKESRFNVRFSTPADVSKAASACATTSNVQIPGIKYRDPPLAFQTKHAPILRRAKSYHALDDLADREGSPVIHPPNESSYAGDLQRYSRQAHDHMCGRDHIRASFARYANVDARSSRSKIFSVHNKSKTFETKIGKVGKGGICHEYSDHGTGDFRTPSFSVVDNYTGSAISPLRYRRHKIYQGKLPMPDSMPAIRCMNESEASTLVVTLADSVSGLEVDLIFGKLLCIPEQ